MSAKPLPSVSILDQQIRTRILKSDLPGASICESRIANEVESLITSNCLIGIHQQEIEAIASSFKVSDQIRRSSKAAVGCEHITELVRPRSTGQHIGTASAIDLVVAKLAIDRVAQIAAQTDPDQRRHRR